MQCSSLVFIVLINSGNCQLLVGVNPQVPFERNDKNLKSICHIFTFIYNLKQNSKHLRSHLVFSNANHENSYNNDVSSKQHGSVRPNNLHSTGVRHKQSNQLTHFLVHAQKSFLLYVFVVW